MERKFTHCTCTHHSPISFTEATGSIKMISCHGNTELHKLLYYRSILPLAPVTTRPEMVWRGGGRSEGGEERRRGEVRGRSEGSR